MKCLETGTIQAYIDGELDIKDKKDTESHIESCDECKSKLDQLRSNDDFAYQKLSLYKDYFENTTVQPSKSSLPDEHKEKSKTRSKEKKIFNFVSKYNKFIAVACALFIFSTCLTIQPVKAVISNVLNVLRVDSLKSIRITPEEINQMKEVLSNGQGEINLDNIGKINMHGGKATPASFEEVQKTYNLPMLKPSVIPEVKPEVQAVEPMTISFTLNVKNTNSLLKLFNSSQMFPDDIDGKTFTARFGAQAQIEYTDNGKSYTLIETTSPQIEVPEGVDADQIFNTVVNLPIIPDELKSKLTSIKDWKHTLYVPLVEPVKEISINGVTTYICSNGTGTGSVSSNALWMNNGIIYGVTGNTGESDLIVFIKSLN